MFILGIQTRFGSIKYPIETASNNVGVPYNIKYKIAKIESNLNPKAKNKRSSARGLYQIINKTEVYLRNKYKIKGSIYNPYVNSLMGAYLIKQSIKFFKRNNIYTSSLNIYLAHFLGNRGAYRFLNYKNDTKLCKVMGKICKYNRFLEGKTIKETKTYFRNKLNNVEIR